MEDSISKLITKHDNEHFTLEQLKEIAKRMFDDAQYGETKNARVMLFSMMYGPHMKRGDSKRISDSYKPDARYFVEIDKGKNLGMEFRKIASVETPTLTDDSELPHNSYRNKFILNVFKYFESTGELELLVQSAEVKDAQFYTDGSKNVILHSDTLSCSSLLLIADEIQIDKRNASQRLWYANADQKLQFGDQTAYVYTAISKKMFLQFIAFVKEFFEGKYSIEKNETTGEYELHLQQEEHNEPAEISFANQEHDQRIFFGMPGGGKSHKVKDIIEGKHAENREFRTTFHPDSDYASFVGSYKPVMEGKEISYQFMPQIFTNAYVAAWNNPEDDYYLVIEEINRGNCAQIFGDIFQLLDRNENGFSEYPIAADADLKKYLEGTNENGEPILVHKQGIKDGCLCLPPNLSILATMNTSDQSLFPMDSAFKRRWAWEFVPSIFKDENNYTLTFDDKEYKWHDFLNAVNPRIKEATDSEDKQLGAYFIKSDMDAKEFISKVMYYLWSEVCKEEYKTRNNFFRHKVGDKPDVEFTFNELYADGKENVTLLNEFMDYILKKE